jgi:hypothetical protein
LTGCARSEQALLEQFFGASRLRDTTALQKIATVVFEPREQGFVRTFRIIAVTPERPAGPTAVMKEVTLEAAVRLPHGPLVQKTLVITMARGRTEAPGKWLITGVRDAEVSRPVPPS